MLRPDERWKTTFRSDKEKKTMDTSRDTMNHTAFIARLAATKSRKIGPISESDSHPSAFWDNCAQIGKAHFGASKPKEGTHCRDPFHHSFLPMREMNPPSKRRKQEESVVEEVPLASVLEWFDTTKKPTTILCRETESKVGGNHITLNGIENQRLPLLLFGQ